MLQVNEDGTISLDNNKLQDFHSQLLKCEALKDPALTHEWLFILQSEAEDVYNYLSDFYDVEIKKYSLLGRPIWYVGVPFSRLIA